MSEEIVTELKNWFLSLSFRDKIISSVSIEEEFEKLCPPEMRDIWRNISNHVKPKNEVRYIKKILLLNELEKQHTRNKIKSSKNLSSVQEYNKLKKYEKVSKDIKTCYNSIAVASRKEKELRLQTIIKDKERKKLFEETTKIIDSQTLISLRIRHHEDIKNDLTELYSLFKAIHSFWLITKIENKNQLIKNVQLCLNAVNDYNNSNSKSEEDYELLIDKVETSTQNIPIFGLYKSVIDLLRNSLNNLIKISDHINAQQSIENTQLESKLNELKKQYVKLFLDNQTDKERKVVLQEDKQKLISQLLSILIKPNSDLILHKENLEKWLDSELLKCSVISEEKFFRQEEEAMKKKIKSQNNVDFSNVNHETLMKNLTDFVDQLSHLELEITNNLHYLSDESFDAFLNCQNRLKNEIEKFSNCVNENKKLNCDIKLKDSLHCELELLRKLDLLAIDNQEKNSESKYFMNSVSPFDLIEYTDKFSFLIYLMNVHGNLFQKMNKLSIEAALFDNKKVQIKEEEEKYSKLLEIRLTQAKNNLEDVQFYSEDCFKNLTLWTELSVNDIIPCSQEVAGNNFADWLKKYNSAVKYLRKQQLEIEKLELLEK